MYIYQRIHGRCYNYFYIIILALFVLYWGCKTSEFCSNVSYKPPVQAIIKENPLLLNSGITDSKKAEVSIIVWFKEGDIPRQIWTERPMADWEWSANSLQTENGRTARTVSGKHFVNKNEENILFTWYTTMARELVKVGGKIYFDERVPQTVDVSAYLSKMNALPSQSYFLGNMVSIAGYIPNLKGDVWAGQDRINIQLLSRGKNTEGQSVLAMPALLEEF